MDCPHPEPALITQRHVRPTSVRTVWAVNTGDVTIVRNINDGTYIEEHHRTESDGTSAATDQEAYS